MNLRKMTPRRKGKDGMFAAMTLGFYIGTVSGAAGKSGGGPPHSKTLRAAR